MTRRYLGAAGVVACAITVAGIVPAGAAYAAATYVVNDVSAECSDTGPGTTAEPLCTIGAAAMKAVAGDTVLVSAGTYPGTSAA